MALIAIGNQFVQDLEKSQALGLYVPLEGGFEGRYRRRLRAAGYTTLVLTARGLGDLSMYLMGVHGIRPPHLGKKDIGQGAAVGARYFAPPIVQQQLEHLPPTAKGFVLWIIEGFVLSNQELEFLSLLPTLEPRVRVVVEVGGDRTLRWLPLKNTLIAAS
ncbi:NAD(P)H-quinone oxidoreductase [Neosynechococcus sphagnicola sy1]|uniref:NAD(P)H-quinone oxidoreductase subunit N n=1 Tax=Neosynechococcus sphagnicola sy1 TaxID=1497020 RepID=A0A098TLE7_9CYAN|nr:NAD(P)H-quinone oxidoreductase subunit N [Neosynechococcus sphagnicola]KGF73071.1 NAD(P)H-quinone oxidoreductase [Neosynechococcus sphagnicola sy1]